MTSQPPTGPIANLQAQPPQPPSRPVISDDQHGIATALQSFSLDLRYNERSVTREILVDNRWHELDDFREARLREDIENNFSFVVIRYSKPHIVPADFSDRKWERSINSYLLTRHVDPFKVWMEALPPWDGRRRLTRMLIDALGVEDTPLARAATRNQMIAAVARTYVPGKKHDIMLIVEGPQGGGKSSLLAELFDSEGFFCDDVAFDEDSKVQIEKTGEAVIVEFDELRGMKQYHLASIKSLLSRRKDRVRFAYARNATTTLRRWVAWGTANDDGTGVIAGDATGTRRFIVLTATNKEGDYYKVVRYARANREQLWAEALYLYRKGISHDLPHKLFAARDAANASSSKVENAKLAEAVNSVSEYYGTGYEVPLSKLRDDVQTYMAKRRPSGITS